ncbi:MAG: pyridoxamine 5'-phosphate oxidase [Chitinophagaceae bacterium]
MSNIDLADIRKDYRMATLSEQDVSDNPFQQFEKWFNEVLHSQIDESNAMALATADAHGRPSARIVLLKGLDDRGFHFYTNYESKKAQQIKENPFGALVFFWKELERQVRIEGKIIRVDEAESDQYYHSRPPKSQIGAWASPQSRVISNRDYLEEKVKQYEEKFKQSSPERPPYWGGYILQPELFEFWQGRASRLHDRIQYSLKAGNKWKKERLAP